MNKLVKTVNKADLYKEFIDALNGILQLTDREKGLLLLLIDLEKNGPKSIKHGRNIINTDNRKHIRKVTGITNDNLTRYLNRLKSKGLLLLGKGQDEWYLNPAIVPEIIGNRIQITLILKADNDD